MSQDVNCVKCKKSIKAVDLPYTHLTRRIETFEWTCIGCMTDDQAMHRWNELLEIFDDDGTIYERLIDKGKKR